MFQSHQDNHKNNYQISILDNLDNNLQNVQNVLADVGYTGENFANSVKEILNCTTEVVKRSEKHKFKVIPKRWIVERSFAWLEKCRRLWKNCERKLDSSLAMVQLAFIKLILNRQ